MYSHDEKLAAIVIHAYANAPAFKRIMEGAGLTPADIRGVADLPRIPITSKDRLVEMQREDPPFGGWLAVPPSQLARIYLSPGPLYDPEGKHDEGGIAAAVESLRAAGFESGDIVLNTFLYHMVPAGLWLDEALRAVGATVVPLGPGNTDLLLMVMMTLGANGYVGTPSFLDSIYGKAGEMKLPLRKAFFSAEPYPASLRQKFEGSYGLRTAQAYGTADLGLVAYERPGQPGFYFPDTLYVEVADPASSAALPDGEVGEVVVTTFNRAYPLIRFGTGDLGVIEAAADGSRRLKGLLGRSGEAVKVRGMFLHPNQLKALAAAFPQIKHVAAVISRPESQDMLTLLVELAEGGTDATLAEALKAALRDQGRLRVDAVEFVAAGTIDPNQRIVRDERKLN